MAYRPMGLERAVKAYFDPIDEERKRRMAEETWMRQAMHSADLQEKARRHSADLQEKARLSAIERRSAMRNILADIFSPQYQDAPEHIPLTTAQTLAAESAYSQGLGQGLTSPLPPMGQEELVRGRRLRERGITKTMAEQRADITRRIKALRPTDEWTTAQLKLAGEFTDPKVRHKILDSGAIYRIQGGKVTQIVPPRKVNVFTDSAGNIKPQTSNSIRHLVAGQFGGVSNPLREGEYIYDLTINSRMALQTVERAEMILQGGKAKSIGAAVNLAMNKLRGESMLGTWRKFQNEEAVKEAWEKYSEGKGKTKKNPIDITGKMTEVWTKYIPQGAWVVMHLVPGSDDWKRTEKERGGKGYIIVKWNKSRLRRTGGE